MEPVDRRREQGQMITRFGRPFGVDERLRASDIRMSRIVSAASNSVFVGLACSIVAAPVALHTSGSIKGLNKQLIFVGVMSGLATFKALKNLAPADQQKVLGYFAMFMGVAILTVAVLNETAVLGRPYECRLSAGRICRSYRHNPLFLP